MELEGFLPSIRDHGLENDQRPIAEIERRASVSFGSLANLDPMRNMDESTPTRLTHPSQIRYV
jgi:hypothetical protein